jgi:hypothetical protein
MSDLFSVSFLAFLGIIVLAIALLVVYFESKSREQNHKIASMFSVVSTLAEDLNNVKMGLNQLAFSGMNGGMNGVGPSLAENIHPFNQNNHLIEVSDDDEEEDENDSEEDENDSEEEDENDSEEEDENDSDSDHEDELDETESEFDSDSEPVNVKVLKIEDPQTHLEKMEQNFENLDDIDENLDSEYDQELFEEEPLQLVENDFVPEEITKNEKSIKIDLGEVVSDVIDYKKLTLQKLKAIVVEKRLATDTSKLKKPDLLKLLGVE